MPRRGRSGVLLVVAVMAVIIRLEPTALHSMASGSRSAPTGPQPRGRSRPAHWRRLSAAWVKRERAGLMGAADHLVTVVSTSRLPIYCRSWRRCRGRGGHRARPLAAAAACTGGATRKPSAKQARGGALARTCRWPAQVALRSGGRGVFRVGQARERSSRARGLVRVQHAHRPRARSGRADRSCAACVAAGRAGTHVDGGLVSLGSEEVGDEVDRRVDRLARIVVCRGASIVMCALGGWCACGVECVDPGLSC